MFGSTTDAHTAEAIISATHMLSAATIASSTDASAMIAEDGSRYHMKKISIGTASKETAERPGHMKSASVTDSPAGYAAVQKA